ncbi:MAG: glycerol-3-phosphate 1-O-acyltransferase PlsY [Candidatus Eisenbacteria bacterium]
MNVHPLLVLGAAFLLGALPFGLWVGRLARGVDVRQHGSGNLGATNVYRSLGARLGLTVFALDAGKGVAAVVLARALAGASFPGGDNAAGLCGAIIAVLGHSFTPFAGFRGGKGAATAAGAMLAATPAASSVALAGFIAAVATTRRISVGSLVAAVLLPLGLWLLPFAWQGNFAAWTGTAVGVLIVLRHLPNVRRILRGEEPTFDFRGGGAR